MKKNQMQLNVHEKNVAIKTMMVIAISLCSDKQSVYKITTGTNKFHHILKKKSIYSDIIFYYIFIFNWLTVSCPAGVTLGAISRMRWGDGRHAGASHEAKGCKAACCDATGAESRGAQAWLAGCFGKQRPGCCNLELGGCCWWCWSTSCMMGEHLIC